MRNMSFSMTTEAVRRRTKTVTRRLGWWNLKPGTLLCAVEKGMGLKKGEKVKRLAVIRVVSSEWEQLANIACPHAYGPEELAAEGFPEMTGDEFAEMFMKANRCGFYEAVNRIEFEYVEEATCLETSAGPRPELPLSGCDYITETWQYPDGSVTKVNFPVRHVEGDS